MFDVTCDRCKKSTNTKTMSIFNTEMICLECKESEEKHPMYELAKKIEYEEVLKGNMNFAGIGLPMNLMKNT